MSRQQKKMVIDNMGLAYQQANRLAIYDPAVDIDDKVQTAAMALCRAVRGYDKHRGAKFSTYASVAIRRGLVDLYRISKRRVQHFRQWSEHDGELAEAEELEPATAINEELAALLAILTETERAVIGQRFGIGAKQRTLRQIAARMHVTHERVRQIEKKAIAKLRRLVGANDGD